MKTEKELNELKEEVENLNKKLAELSEDELMQVSGGSSIEEDTITKFRDGIKDHISSHLDEMNEILKALRQKETSEEL